MGFRIFDAEGKVTVDDQGVDRGLSRIRNKVRETVARVDAMEGTAQLKADASQLDREIEKTRAKMRSVDRQRATATADMDLTQFDVAEAKLKAKIKALQREKVEIDVRMGRDLKLADRALVGITQRLRGVGRVTPWQDVQRLGDALHNARITMGPLSLSLRGLIVALLTLSPLVTAAAGGIGGLAAVASQALVGGLGLAASAALGFGAVLGGVVAAVAAHRKEFSQFGDDIKGLAAEFKRQTHIPDSFFGAIREGIRTARADMPLFTNAVNTAMDTIGKRTDELARSLRSGAMRSAFKQLFGNVNEALGPALKGISSLIRAGGLVAASFSRFFGPAMKGFRDWAASIEDAARDTDKLDGTVDELMSSVVEVGNLFKEAGRLVVNFFMAGGPAGRHMVRDISDLVGKWADWMDTKEGQRAVTNFLNDSWDTIKKVAKFIEQIVRLIDNLATAGKPVVDWLLDAATQALALFNNLEDSTGAGDELVTALAGLIILRKAVGWAAALMGLLGGGVLLKGLKGIGKGLLSKILFPSGAAAAGAGLGGAFRVAIIAGLRGAGIAGAAFLVGEIASGIRSRFSAEFDKAGVPDVIKRAFQTAFDFSAGGQLAAAVETIKHPIEALKKSWENLSNLPGVRLVASFVDRVKGPVRSAFNFARNTFRRGVDLIGRFVSNVPAAARTAYNFAKRLFGQGVALIGHLIDAVTAPARSVFNRARGVFNRGITLLGRLIDQVTGPARSVFNRVRSIFRPGADIVASLIDNATSVASSIMSTLESIFHDITVNIHIPTPSIPSLPHIGNPFNARGGVHGVTGYARGTEGGGVGTPVTPRMIEQAMQSGSKRRDGGKVFAPKFLNSFNIAGEELGNSEFVIPTNPAYRRRARMLLAQAASAIGTGFARGTAAARKKHKPRRRRKVYSGSHYLFPVRQLEDEIAMKDNALTQYDRRYNTDSRFRPLTDDDGQRIEANISWHLTQLADLEARATHLMKLERRLADAIGRANNRIRKAMDAWGQQRPPATIVKGRGKNKKRVDNPAFKRWADKMNGLRDARGEVPESEAQQALFRADDYESEAYSYKADQREVRETKSTPMPAPDMQMFLASQGLAGTLQSLNLGVAQAAATIGDTTDDQQAQGALASFWGTVISRLGSGGDKDLLTEAYTNLASAREGATPGAESGPTIGEQTMTFNAARDELFRSFGSNFSSSSGGILGAISSGVSAGVISGLTDTRSGVLSSPAIASGQGDGGGGGTTIQQTNNFAAPPPDPHTFVKSTMWEAQSV